MCCLLTNQRIVFVYLIQMIGYKKPGEVIKNGERRLLHAKKLIADLKAEVQSLRSRNDHQEPEQQTPQPEQQTVRGRDEPRELP